MRYHVEFELNGKKKVVAFTAENAGCAFAACLKAFPGARVTAAEARGIFGSGDGFTTYEPPPAIRFFDEPGPAGMPAPDDHSCVFGFYDQVVKERVHPF